MSPLSPSLTEALNPALYEKLVQADALSRMQLAKDSRLRPLMIIIETINVCNSECVFCPYTIQTRPKGVMSEALFSQVVHEYVELGGGAISLTPMVGDVLLDRKLPSRMETLRLHAGKLIPSITTNLYALEHWSDERVIEMLTTFFRIHISCYGLTEEENQEITRKNYHATFCQQMVRLLRLKREHGAPAEVALGFRTLYDYTQQQTADFQRQVLGEVLSPAGATAVYANWGDTMRGALPGHARWVAERENHTACLLLAIALQIYHDGRVSACACCDYNASPELTLGSIKENSLPDLFNGLKNQQIWTAHQNNQLPKICQRCTFHMPLDSLVPGHPALASITHFIGG
jgi:radical SAM protein with 4Fe4S-binding SPASM domain